jgi:integrase
MTKEKNPDRLRVGDRVTIYPRGKKAIWCADFWQDGRHCRQSLETANMKFALERARKIEVELVSGVYEQPPREVAIAQAFEDYVRYLETENRSRTTVVKYRGIFRTLMSFLVSLRVTRLHQFATVHFDRFRAERKKDHHPRTMYTEGVVIKQFFKWCKSRKLIRENPIADYKLVRPPLVPKEGPSLQQVNSILAASRGVFMIMLAVLAFTGMRSGELQRLRKEDLDLAGNWIHVISRSGAETKTRHSRRVPIHPRLAALLRKLTKSQGPWLFCAVPSRRYPNGDHWLNPKKLNDRFTALVRKLGMPLGRDTGYTIHSLRHSFETIAVNAGIPQRVIDTWLGHHADKSMAAVYYKLKDEDSQEFMNRLPFESRKPAAAAASKEVANEGYQTEDQESSSPRSPIPSA